jgi:hypothetical protein
MFLAPFALGGIFSAKLFKTLTSPHKHKGNLEWFMKKIDAGFYELR